MRSGGGVVCDLLDAQKDIYMGNEDALRLGTKKGNNPKEVLDSIFSKQGVAGDRETVNNINYLIPFWALEDILARDDIEIVWLNRDIRSIIDSHIKRGWSLDDCYKMVNMTWLLFNLIKPDYVLSFESFVENPKKELDGLLEWLGSDVRIDENTYQVVDKTDRHIYEEKKTFIQIGRNYIDYNNGLEHFNWKMKAYKGEYVVDNMNKYIEVFSSIKSGRQ